MASDEDINPLFEAIIKVALLSYGKTDHNAIPQLLQLNTIDRCRGRDAKAAERNRNGGDDST